MINLISQGKIIRQFWDKIIRHSTRKKWRKMRTKQLTKCKFGGGGHLEQLSNDQTLFIVPKRRMG